MKQNLLLIAIVVIAIFFRFFHIATNPPSLTWDETAWGYNAYALGIDGRDEFGRFLPHDYLESFGDYKPPMYAYLDVLPVKAFGLNEFATRFPSALFGVLTVLMTYFLVKQLFYTSQKKEWYALIAAGVLAISPWHILLSRAAFEANIATFFLVSGVFLFLIAIRNASHQWKKYAIVLSVISFVLSVYTFNSARIVAPLITMVLFIVFYKHLWQYKKQTIIAIIAGIILILPTVKFLLSPQASLRFQEVNIFSDVSLVNTANQEIGHDHNAWWSKIIHNRRIVYSLAYLQHYFDNLTPDFLFIHGDGNPKFSIQDVAQMYIWDLPFFFIGIFYLFKYKEGYWWIIPCWLLLGIFPAATARETPHTLRIEATLPTFQIFVAYGIVEIISKIQFQKSNFKLRRSVLTVIGILLLTNVLYFSHQYFIEYPREFSGEWQYGYYDSISYVEKVKNQYQHIIVTDTLGRPYIYYLFYTKTDPAYFRKTADISRDVFGFVDVKSFNSYIFASDLSKYGKERNSLFIGDANKIPAGSHIVQTFYLLNGNPVLVAYTR